MISDARKAIEIAKDYAARSMGASYWGDNAFKDGNPENSYGEAWQLPSKLS